MPVRLRSSGTPLPPDYPNGDTKIGIKINTAKFSALYRHLLNKDKGYKKNGCPISNAGHPFFLYKGVRGNLPAIYGKLRTTEFATYTRFSME